MEDGSERERETGESLHPELISSVNEDMPDEEMLYDLAELFKVFGDSTRISDNMLTQKKKYLTSKIYCVKYNCTKHKQTRGHDYE